MDVSRPLLGSSEGLERRHSDTSVPQAGMVTITSTMSAYGFTDSLRKGTPSPDAAIQHSHFVIMYIDDDGKLQIRTSDSIAGCGGAIFTPEVTDRFMEMTAPNPQSNMQFTRECHSRPKWCYGEHSQRKFVSSI